MGAANGNELDGEAIGDEQMIDIEAALVVPTVVVDAGDEGEFMIVQRISSRKIFANDSIADSVFQRSKIFLEKGLDKMDLSGYHMQVV